MSFSIATSASFERKLKRLAKKYPSLKSDLAKLEEALTLNPAMGTPLGQDCYKVRLAITSKRQGKSGGARIITCVFVVTERVYLLTIYDKSEQDNIGDKEIGELRKIAFTMENAVTPPLPGSENPPSGEVS